VTSALGTTFATNSEGLQSFGLPCSFTVNNFRTMAVVMAALLLSPSAKPCRPDVESCLCYSAYYSVHIDTCILLTFYVPFKKGGSTCDGVLSVLHIQREQGCD
jgi:hypothetical protein